MNLDELMQKTDAKLRGEMGLYVCDLRDGAEWGLRPDEVFSTASVIKLQILAVLCEQAKRGALSLDETIAVRGEDVVKGSGLLRHMRLGDAMSLYNLAVLMISISDNTATNVVIDRLGVEAINAQLEEWGFERTTLHRKITFDQMDSAKCEWLAGSSPRETGGMLARVARRELVGGEWDAMIERILETQKSDTAIHRGIPGYGDLDDEENEPVRIADKTGAVDGVRNDCGIVFAPFGPYVISAFTRKLADNRYHPDNEGKLAIARVSAGVFEHLAQRRPRD